MSTKRKIKTEIDLIQKRIEIINLKDLKIESETFKVISKYKDDPEFQKIFLDSFISGTKGIKSVE